MIDLHGKNSIRGLAKELSDLCRCDSSCCFKGSTMCISGKRKKYIEYFTNYGRNAEIVFEWFEPDLSNPVTERLINYFAMPSYMRIKFSIKFPEVELGKGYEKIKYKLRLED